MAPHKTESSDIIYHMSASGLAAIINFPLWRAAAIAQSGFKLEGKTIFHKYYKAVIHPPFRGLGATIFGMTWARAFIFFGSDMGKQWMEDMKFSPALCQTVPAFLIGAFVQVANMPIVRATITIQDPKCELKNTWEALKYINKTRGIPGLYHGCSVAVFKTVPKYICAVAVKDILEDKLSPAPAGDKTALLVRSAIKSVAAGVAGAALTNPLDVLRNEMFKTDLGITATFKKLMKEDGWAFMGRGLTSNMTAVAMPIAMTIFFTDLLMTGKNKNKKSD